MNPKLLEVLHAIHTTLDILNDAARSQSGCDCCPGERPADRALRAVADALVELEAEA